jgi:hypothetical protein
MKNKSFLLCLPVLILLVLSVPGCQTVSYEDSEPIRAEAVFVEAIQRPATSGMVFGPHLGFDGKLHLGPHLGTVPEVNSTAFRWSKTGEQVSTSSKEICARFIGVPKGTKADVLCKKTFRVTYEGRKIVEKVCVGTEILDAKPIINAEDPVQNR